jgi:hypothetical protein
MWRPRNTIYKKLAAKLLARPTGTGPLTPNGITMVPEFRMISTGLARERVSAEDPADVLQDVLKELKANVDCLGINYDVMLARGVLCGYIVTTKASRELLVTYGDVLNNCDRLKP